MKEANCKNQNCIHQGRGDRRQHRHRYLGARIICLPNKVIVELSPRPSSPSPPNEIPVGRMRKSD